MKNTRAMLSAPRSREHGAAAHDTSPERLQRSPSSMKLSQGEFRARWLRRAAILFGLVVAALLLLRCATEVVSLFHWAEHHIDRESPTHMLLFFAVTLPFNLGVPVPLVHQAWAVAVLGAARSALPSRPPRHREMQVQLHRPAAGATPG